MKAEISRGQRRLKKKLTPILGYIQVDRNSIRDINNYPTVRSIRALPENARRSREDNCG